MNRFMNPGLLGHPAQQFQQVSPLEALLGVGAQQPMPQQAAMMPSMNPQQNRTAGGRQLIADLMMGIGAGLASGNPGASAAVFQQQLSDGRERKQRDASRNATLQWMRGQAAKNPLMGELIGLVEADVLTPGDAFKMAMQKPDPGYRVLTMQEKQQYGLDPRTPFQVDGSGKISQIGGGGVTVNNMGNIPPGHQLFQDPETGAYRMDPIPGSPDYIERQQAAQAQQSRQAQAGVTSDTILNASKRALEAARQRRFGAYGQPTGAVNPFGNEAEVARQVDVLKAMATIETLNAMRQASPSGASGLGAVTREEHALLIAKHGALDPASPNFERDLQDYTRTLLQIVHGAEEGDRIFAESMAAPAPRRQGAQTGTNEIDSLVDQYRSR